jgi:hypothetical protein
MTVRIRCDRRQWIMESCQFGTHPISQLPADPYVIACFTILQLADQVLS